MKLILDLDFFLHEILLSTKEGSESFNQGSLSPVAIMTIIGHLYSVSVKNTP